MNNSQWLGGQTPSAADAQEFEKLKKAPTPDKHPNAFAWYFLMAQITPEVRGGWTGGKAEPEKEQKKKENKSEIKVRAYYC